LPGLDGRIHFRQLQAARASTAFGASSVRAPVLPQVMTTDAMTTPLLSKSRFLAGLQCPLRLWYQCFRRELAAPVSAAQQAIFEMGRQVGILATERYPAGVPIVEDFRRHADAEKATRAAMADPEVSAVFEAAFTADRVRVRVDILQRAGNGGWNLIEVKSSTGVKEEHLFDTGIQTRILQEAGVKLASAGLMHINRDYVYEGGPRDLFCLFTLADLTDEVARLQEEIGMRLEALQQVVSRPDPPEVVPSRHCLTPYRCEFWEHCTRSMPEHWIMTLPGINAERFDALSSMGVVEISEVPDTAPVSAIQQRVVDCVRQNREYVSEGLGAALSHVDFPLHFLDFETAAPAVPVLAGTRPFEMIPFQWSDHVLTEDGRLEHLDFLSTGGDDPRPAFIDSLLCTLGAAGTIFIYSPYEKTVLNHLALRFSERVQEMAGVIDRFTDLWAVIRRHYYHPAFHGSFSLKAVLPVLVPEMGYSHLAVQDGTQASFAYLRMIDPETQQKEKRAIAENLRTYCGQDTLAMVRIREVLLEKARNPNFEK